MSREPFDYSRILAFWHANEEPFIARMVAAAAEMPNYRDLPRDELDMVIRRKTGQWQRLLASGDTSEALGTSSAIARERAAARFPLLTMIASGDLFRDHVTQLFRDCYADDEWPVALVEQNERWHRDDRNAMVEAYSVVLQESWDELADREQVLAGQRALVRELSTPIIPVYEGVLVLPLVGQIDSQRASEIADTALSRIVETQADLLILDTTGVSVIDTQVANDLLLIARAVRLLGGQVILVGISAEVAQAIVHLGIDMDSFAIRSNLQDGIAYALDQLGFGITRVRRA